MCTWISPSPIKGPSLGRLWTHPRMDGRAFMGSQNVENQVHMTIEEGGKAESLMEVGSGADGISKHSKALRLWCVLRQRCQYLSSAPPICGILLWTGTPYIGCPDEQAYIIWGIPDSGDLVIGFENSQPLYTVTSIFTVSNVSANYSPPTFSPESSLKCSPHILGEGAEDRK